MLLLGEFCELPQNLSCALPQRVIVPPQAFDLLGINPAVGVGLYRHLIDIIGTAILLCKINPDVIYSSIVNDGYGFIECAHGMISVPVPATSEIFAASNAITRQIDVDTELVTPTGAAIIAEIASEFTTMPAMNVQKVGWGTGTKDLVIPNVLKVSLGEIKKKTKL